MAVHFAAGCAEHPARRDRADAGAAGAGLRVRRARQRARHAVFSRQDTIVLYWFLEVFFLSGSRFAYRYFRYTRVRRHARSEDASPALLIGRAADAEILLRGIESGAVKRIWPVGMLSPSPADRGQTIREHPGAGRHRRYRGRDPRFCTAQQADHAPGDDAVGVRAGGAARSRADAGAPARPDRQPAAVAGERRRAAADQVAVEDLLLRPSEKIDYARLEALVKGKSVIVTGGGGSIGSEICDRVVTFGAARLLVIENSEPALYAVTEALAAHGRQRRRSRAGSPIFATASASCG